jgi:hypothetical protein
VSRRILPTIPWEQLPDSYKKTLRDLGYTKKTYEKVQQAQELLWQANASMRRRKGNLKFNIGYVAGPFDILYRKR